MSVEPRQPLKEPDVLFYDAPFQLYGLGFSHSTSHPARAAVTSFIPTSTSNKLQIIDRNPEVDPNGDHHHHHHGRHTGYSSSSHHLSSPRPDYTVLAQASHPFPATRVTWEPRPSSSRLISRGEYEREVELIATTGDALRVWEVERGEGGAGGQVRGDEDEEDEDEQEGNRLDDVARIGWRRHEPKVRLRERSKLTNGKVPLNQVPPLTSFSWSDHSPNLLVTSSIDTTCTLWDIHTSTALTQLIAHDRAVHDVSFLPHSPDVFVSVGSDGSLRAFDLRALEHSTILYEDPQNRPLMRVEFGQKEQHYLGVFGMGDEAVQVLDMRSPGTAVVELVGHKKGRDGAVNAIAWGCEGRAGHGGGGWIASCGDDAQVLVYDCTQPLPYPTSSSNPSSVASSPAHFTPPPPTTMGTGTSARTTPGDLSHHHHQQQHGGVGAASSSSSSKKVARQLYSSGPTPGASRHPTPGGQSTGGHHPSIPKRYPSRAWNNQLDGFLSSSQVGSAELNNLAWSGEGGAGSGAEVGGVWLGVVGGRRLSCLRF